MNFHESWNLFTEDFVTSPAQKDNGSRTEVGTEAKQHIHGIMVNWGMGVGVLIRVWGVGDQRRAVGQRRV